MIICVNYFNRIRRAILVFLLSLGVLSCGTEGIVAAGISGTGIVFGSITGFGSIFVNGIEYEIDKASFDVDGQSFIGLEGQNQLQIGMVVKLNATTYDDGTGLATSVVYDDSVEGPITGQPIPSATDYNVKEFSVLGQVISINAITTNFKSEDGVSFGFDEIFQDDVVEVSGFVDPQTSIIRATHVEKKGSILEGNNEVQLHGMIENLTEDKNTFYINGIPIDSSLITDNHLEDLDELINGIYIEVKGEYQPGGSILAIEIEGEDDDREEISASEGDLSLEGIVSSIIAGGQFLQFSVNGIPVLLDSTLFPAEAQFLKAGMKVNVKGDMLNGELRVTKIEVEDEEDGEDGEDEEDKEDEED